MSDKLTREEVLAFQTKLIEWTELVEEIANEIECIADNLDGHFNRISKAKIGGSTFGIIGSILSIVGFGLSFATFGASLGLTIAGTIQIKNLANKMQIMKSVLCINVYQFFISRVIEYI